MKYVRKQLLLIEELVEDMLDKTRDRSFWSTLAIRRRVKEAEAIKKSAEALVALVRQSKPE